MVPAPAESPLRAVPAEHSQKYQHDMADPTTRLTVRAKELSHGIVIAHEMDH